MDRIEYEMGTASDYEEIVDFANYVFSYDHDNSDFPTLLPKFYRKGSNKTQYHYLAKSQGKILAMVASFPSKAMIMGQEFKVAGIGTVCVHPYYRGLGLMKSLMSSAMDDMKRDGVAFSVLSGQRQRYEYFGFEPCGTKLNFTITAANIRHHFKGSNTDNFTFVPMANDDKDCIHKALKLQQRQSFFVVRQPLEFYDTCCSWKSSPYIILENGKFAGYLVCSEDKTSISELELSEPSGLSGALIAYLSSFGVDAVQFNLAPYEQEKIKIIETFCEKISIESVYSFNLFDYENMIRQLLKLKAAYTKLSEGQLVLEIEGRTKLRIGVCSQNVSVTKTSDPPDIVLTHLMALRFLFSPLSSSFSYAPNYQNCTASWFPLPIYWPVLDGI